MQNDIIKRALMYGIAAVLLAAMLIALLYNVSLYQTETRQTETPIKFPSSVILKTFASYDELRNFLTTNSKIQGTFPFYGPWDVRLVGPLPVPTPIPVPAPAGEAIPKGSPYYSTTNIQVAGVDEADIVKTDGEYIYLISGNSVYILKAYPPEEAEVVSKITFNNHTYPIGIFIALDGGRLTVLGSKYTYHVPSRFYYGSVFIDARTFAYVYDISDKENPALLRNFTISGSYFNSRLIGDYVYFVTSQPAYVIYDTVILPKIYLKEGFKEISASEIYHPSNASDDYFQFTTVVALNMQNTQEEPTYTTLMLGGTSSMYVSLSNIYVTFPDPEGNTAVYRIRIKNSTVTPEAQGKVPGRELNQFSMDEYNNHFRIATTSWLKGETQNNVYILDMNLNIVGSLENIAPGETIDSARFIGDRCYLATSVIQKDPFFVIDVENPMEPKILGYLKIPGFTRYLHPYDEDHMIGIGMDEGNVKISLFDVSNVSAPIEMGKYKVSAPKELAEYAAEGVWSDTLVLTEHKAFLFDKSRGLLVIPVSIYDVKGGFTWQSAYVFNVTLTHGISLRGSITHQESILTGWDSLNWVKRALYIENVLYTVSDVKVKMNSLEDLMLINTVKLS
ncbi:MAG: beta-propeller domain-containing protein [Candidatus Bathyarchaeia archaeon]